MYMNIPYINICKLNKTREWRKEWGGWLVVMVCAIVLLVNYQTTRNISDLFIYANTFLKINPFCSFKSGQKFEV